MSLNVSRGSMAVLLALTFLPGVARAESPEGPVAIPQEPVATRASLPPPAHPFAAMAGSWSGGGSIELTGDIKENLRCRATYNYGTANNSLALNIRCASDNYKFELASNVVERNGRVSGTWSEAAYKVSGNISGRMVGNNIAAVAQGDNFNADLSVTTTANRMMVTMTPKATYVIAVKMAFNRGGR
ncbi:MAG: hypothetical protein K2Z80_08820 [Xanthobacteraceae bacterium]|nr:hypothetical protein [Xanthobacteraceae bacterium]